MILSEAVMVVSVRPAKPACSPAGVIARTVSVPVVTSALVASSTIPEAVADAASGAPSLPAGMNVNPIASPSEIVPTVRT